jgi:hypothetical protein
MKILDQKEDQENDGLMVYLRLWETLQLKRPTEELETANCPSLNAERQLRKGRRRRRRNTTLYGTSEKIKEREERKKNYFNV